MPGLTRAEIQWQDTQTRAQVAIMNDVKRIADALEDLCTILRTTTLTSTPPTTKTTKTGTT